MRLNFSKSWIFRGWIIFILVTIYAQNTISKSLQCDEKHYLKGSICCNKCKPGQRMFAECDDSPLTKCVGCSHGEYQPNWNVETRCLQQKFCDPGKGFMSRPDNREKEEPCRCLPNFQCSPINCEYCERLPTCNAGHGLEVDPDSPNRRKICVPCKKGFFSNENGASECKKWTSCKAEGRSETQSGSAEADAVCGPPISGAASSWVIVSVLSVITVLCLLILLLFCYKDKLKLLSVNLRSCVQNLKRTRIQQETLAPLYHSVAGGGLGGPGGPKCSPCEATKLICQAPPNLTDEHPCSYPNSNQEMRVSLPLSREVRETNNTQGEKVMEEQCKGIGGPEEVSEEEVVSMSPLMPGSCVCGIPVHEPLEVGENEDCSQAVNPATPGKCFCGGLDGERNGDESEKADSGGEMGGGDREKCVLSKSEASVLALVSMSPPLLHTSSANNPSSPQPELSLPVSQANAGPEVKSCLKDRSLGKQEGLYRLANADTENCGPSGASAMTSVSPLMTSSSSSVGEVYLEKPSGSSAQEQGQSLCWGDSGVNKLLSRSSELECPPESLQSQLVEPTLTSGQVSGNRNTTFISSGQVMNFSGDVIVVYVSQTSLGSDGGGVDNEFGSPVQEQANETAPFFQSSLRSPGDSINQNTLEEDTLPVQEAMEQFSCGK